MKRRRSKQGTEMLSEETKEKWDARIKFLNDHLEKLSDWEESFVWSIEEQRADGKDLTSRQVSKLYEIYHGVESKVG